MNTDGRVSLLCVDLETSSLTAIEAAERTVETI